MKRRQFIHTVPVTIGGMSLSAYATSPLIRSMSANLYDTDRVLIVVQLNGGNDGLNTIIPLDQYDTLYKFRDNLLMPQDKVLKLNDKTGIHPAMHRFKQMFDDNQLAVIQSAGYPSFNFSHFRASDIWVSGSGSKDDLNSGWLGRYINYEYPNYPVGFPNPTMPDPPAIRIGSNVGLGLQNNNINMGISINNTNDPLNLASNIYRDPVSSDCKGKEVAYIREIQRQTDKFGDVVQGAATKGKNMSSLYATSGNSLSDALKIVAKLISGGLKTRIYWVNLGGFDTHSAQVAADRTTGSHANLLGRVSDAIYAFMDDMKLQGFEDRVVGMTFSEFGRRVKSNASGGTDHGAAQPMFVFGKKIIPGVLGVNPIIDPNSNVSSNVPMQYDFRSVYASFLKDWFCVPNADLESIMLYKLQALPVLDAGNCIPTDTHEQNNKAGENLIYAYPNPFVERTNIKFESKGGYALIQVFNNAGVLVKDLYSGELPEGSYKQDLDLGTAPNGIYYIRVQTGIYQQVKAIHKVN
ncbi:MAG: DUF1501 domain-containing protein [Saprospiraceae bacterium]|nr:DUF1501 domain-containing protein [Saprospiraceae bacterium]